MALTSTSKQISSLKINKVPSAAVYNKMVAQNLINDDELYLVQETEHERESLYTWCTEQTLRETYLKAFEKRINIQIQMKGAPI